MNRIKDSAGGLALQVTKETRDAGLVLENMDGEATRLADVIVYGFDDLLLVIDTDRVTAADRAELVASAARDIKSIYQGSKASIQISGHGYQVQLPGARDAGFNLGDKAPVRTVDSVLVIHDGTQRRLAEDLITIREEQIEH